MWILLGVSGAYLAVRFAATGAIQGLAAWADYDRFLQGRRSVTDALSFWDFVTAYSILPLLIGAAIADLLLRPWRWPRRVFAIAGLLGLLLLVSLALFQKRSLFVGLLIAAGVVLLHPGARAVLAALASQRRRTLAAAGGTLAAAYALYLALLVAPVVSETLDPAEQDPSVVVSVDFSSGAGGWLTAGEFVNAGADRRVAAGRVGQGLSVSAAEPLEGITYASGATARARSAWEFTVGIYAPKPTDVTVLVGDDAVDTAVTTVRAGPSWRSARVRWTPLREVEQVKLALRATEAARFRVDDVTLRRLTPKPRTRPGPLTCLGRHVRPRSRRLVGRGRVSRGRGTQASHRRVPGQGARSHGDAAALQGVTYATGERATPGETWTLRARLRGDSGSA